MSKSCLVNGCEKDVAFSCECTGKPIFMCTLHPSNHLLVKGNHQIIGLLFKPNKDDVNDIKEDYALASFKIKSLIDETLKNTEILIRKTIETSDKLIKYLDDIQIRLQKLFKKSLVYDEINIQDFELLKIIASEDIKSKFNSLENVVGQLRSIYDIDLSVHSAFLVLPGNNQVNNLQALDLKNQCTISLTLGLLDLNIYPPPTYNLNSISGFCTVGSKSYCLFCGPTAYLIDFKSNTCKILVNNLNYNNTCGIVCKEEIVYLFSSNNGSMSYALDLNKKSFKSISSISSNINNNYYDSQCREDLLGYNYRGSFRKPSPQSISGSNLSQTNGSASLIQNEIMLTGFNIDGLYNYNHKQNTYKKIIDIQASFNKYILKDWVITSERKLYENLGKSLTNFTCYSNNVEVSFPLVTSYRVYRGFIYFMDKLLKLLRINTKSKKVEIISYTKSDTTILVSVSSQVCLQQANCPNVYQNPNPFC